MTLEEALLSALRDAARAEILPRFRNLGSGDIDTKTGPDDLVTVADRAAEAHLAHAIARILPGAAIVGEEAVSDDPSILGRLAQGGVCVIVDPIDGTANYAHGLSTFGMILAVTRDGRPDLGLLYDPLLDDAVVARAGGGTWFVRGGTARRLAVRALRPLARAQGFLPLSLFDRATQQPALAALGPRVGRMQSLRCSCHEYRQIALGHADFVVSQSAKPWDHVAGLLAVTEAGGDAGDLSGGAHEIVRTNAMLVAATGPAMRDAVAGMIGGALRA